MLQDQGLRRALAKSLLMAMLALLGLPLFSYGFVRYVQNGMDNHMQAAITKHLDEEKIADVAERAALARKYQALLPSKICGNTASDPDAQEMRAELCTFTNRVWQFHWARTISLVALGLGVLVLLVVSGLGVLAFQGRAAQYTSLLVGWRFLQLASALLVTVQGVLAVWLSFWLTAHFFNRYVPKLIVAIALMVAMGLFLVLKQIFQRVRDEDRIDGETLNPLDAPALFNHVKDIAAKMQTAPPAHIIAGIDANFFVTEAPMAVGEKTVQGRTLFVSIPLLRQLTYEQASAVLSHELAHFSGGDTVAGARLGPLLNRYDHYLSGMEEGGITTVLVFPVMHLFRQVLQLALSRESRQREFRADRLAARVISAQAVSESLVKIGAYAQYRNRLENQLFDSKQQLGKELGLSSAVAQGLGQYAVSDDFAGDMQKATIPHPFDSHPPLHERMQNVGHVVQAIDMAGIVQAKPTSSWADDIGSATDIEQRLWSKYEEQFSQHHTEALAWRYEPANAEEQALVEQYFPPQSFTLKAGQLQVDWRGITPAGDAFISWDEMHEITLQDNTFGDTLVVALKEKRLGGLAHKTRIIKLRGLGKQGKELLRETLNRYWGRHQTMRQFQQEEKAQAGIGAAVKE